MVGLCAGGSTDRAPPGRLGRTRERSERGRCDAPHLRNFRHHPPGGGRRAGVGGLVSNLHELAFSKWHLSPKQNAKDLRQGPCGTGVASSALLRRVKTAPPHPEATFSPADDKARPQARSMEGAAADIVGPQQPQRAPPAWLAVGKKAVVPYLGKGLKQVTLD